MHFFLFCSISLIHCSSSDVEAGVCLHGEGDDSNKLMRVTQSSMLAANSLSDICARCQSTANFSIDPETEESTCICTPHCGSCDPNPSYSDEDSGYMCINLSKYVDTQKNGGTPQGATLIPKTGGVTQGMPYGYSAECTFGRTYRAHKRGTKYDAAVANIPNHSVVIIDMDKMEKKCTVEVPGKPGRVIYVPDTPVEILSANMSGSAGASATFALALLMGMAAAMI